MSAPTPAQPSDGANFYRLRDLPDEWEMSDPEGNWESVGEVRRGLWDYCNEDIVEARPKPEPLVAVMLPKSTVVELAGAGFVSTPLVAVVAACRKALESDS